MTETTEPHRGNGADPVVVPNLPADLSESARRYGASAIMALKYQKNYGVWLSWHKGNGLALCLGRHDNGQVPAMIERQFRARLVKLVTEAADESLLRYIS